ncbi:MAG: hypothetical protein IKU25_03695 [Clostridia bacterium]|nr:hypothetical protein [Clostridia bacterium]
MNVSFSGFNEKSITFEANDSVKIGAPVKVSANGTVSACGQGDVFCGVATDVRGGYATVQTSGYVKIKYSADAPTLGYTTLVAGSDGSVSVDESGRTYLVTYVDTTESTVGFML